MVLHSMVLYVLALFTCLVSQTIQEKTQETKRILASDPNYVHSLELGLQDLKQKYETSTARLTADLAKLTTELEAQNALTSQVSTELGTQKALTSQLTTELGTQKALTSQLTKELGTQKALTSQLTTELGTQKNLTSQQTMDITRLKQNGHGGSYVRWGRKTCPDNSTELVYSGYAGGSWYDHTGAAANYICIPSDPQWYSTATTDGGRVYGAEYEQAFAGSATYNDDVTCCVCRPATRSSILMIPGRTSCYPGWHTEYQGYLASGHYTHKAASEYVCLDKHPEALQHGKANEDGKLFYEVAAECGSLPCPPYYQSRRMACVVCSK